MANDDGVAAREDGKDGGFPVACPREISSGACAASMSEALSCFNDSAALADPVVATWLDVQVGSALLLIQRLLRDAERRPVEHLEVRASSEHYRPRMTFEADKQRPDGIRLLDFSSSF